MRRVNRRICNLTRQYAWAPHHLMQIFPLIPELLTFNIAIPGKTITIEGGNIWSGHLCGGSHQGASDYA